MKTLLKHMVVFVTMILVFGCVSNISVETKTTPLKHYPPKDYFENVFWNDIGYEIPSHYLPHTEKIGTIRIQADGLRSSLIDQAKNECRRIGGNWIILDSYWSNPNGPDKLIASAYILNWGKDKNFVGQLVVSGFTEPKLKEEWRKRGILPYEGIYQSITSDNGYKFKIGIWLNTPDDKYYVNYLGGMSAVRSWREGDVIGVFDSTAFPDVFLGDWVKLDKYSTAAELIFSNSGAFTVSYIPWSNSEKQEFTYIRTYPKDIADTGPVSSRSSGSGFLLSNQGYIVTCYHVIEDASEIHVIDNNRNKTRLQASVEVIDPYNDLCVLKVKGLTMEAQRLLPYGFDDSLNKTGEEVFCMGYPLTQYMGNEIKVTNGIISSVTGFQGDVSSYQISAPTQPGNSGGPLFNASGNVIGIMNASIANTDNVSYAVKTAFLHNLISLLDDDVRLTKTNQINSTLSAKVEKFKQAVYLIEVEY